MRAKALKSFKTNQKVGHQSKPHDDHDTNMSRAGVQVVRLAPFPVRGNRERQDDDADVARVKGLNPSHSI